MDAHEIAYYAVRGTDRDPVKDVEEVEKMIKDYAEQRLETESAVETIVKRLEELGEGLYYCGHWPKFLPFGFSKGWITIDKDDRGWGVLWTNGKETHQRMGGSAYSVTIRDSAIWMVAKTAIWLHEVRGKEEQKKIVEFVFDKINEAYNWEAA